MRQIRQIILCSFLGIILVCSCTIFKSSKTTQSKKIDLVKEFFQLTEKYSNDTMMFNWTINREKSRFVNQRTFKDWDKLRMEIQEFYLQRIVSTNVDILVDSITIDTMKSYINSKSVYPNINKIHRLTLKENIYKVIDSIFIKSILVNKEGKFAKTIPDDCIRFRTGKFELRDSKMFTYNIDRSEKEEHTYSDHDDDQWFSKIEWISNNRYLEMTADRNWPTPNYDSAYVNIYETTDTSYYFIIKRVPENYYYEGYVVKIE